MFNAREAARDFVSGNREQMVRWTRTELEIQLQRYLEAHRQGSYYTDVFPQLRHIGVVVPRKGTDRKCILVDAEEGVNRMTTQFTVLLDSGLRQVQFAGEVRKSGQVVLCERLGRGGSVTFASRSDMDQFLGVFGPFKVVQTRLVAPKAVVDV